MDAGIRVGVIGCGYWGSKHARVLSSLAEVDRLVLVDSRPDRLEAVARSLPAAIGFASLREALPEIDAAVIATPPATHVKIGVEALRAGKHVLVEKPLATSTIGAARLVSAASEERRVLMVGHTFEYNAAVWKLRELIHSGELGELYYLDSARLNLGLYQADVNVVWDLAPHDVSIANYLLGTQPSAVHAWAGRHAHRRLEDVAYLRLYYDEIGLTANIHISWLDPCKVRRVTAVGSRKMAVYNDLGGDERIRVHDKGVCIADTDVTATERPMSYRYGDITSPFVALDEPLLVQDRHFVSCVMTDDIPRSDGASGMSVVRVLECAQRSLDEERRVELDELVTLQPVPRMLTEVPELVGALS